MSIYSALQLLYGAFLVLVCAYAFRCGGRDEKIGAALVLVCSAVSFAIAIAPGFAWHHDHNKIMFVDLVLFVGLGALATLSKGFWPLWATAFQMIDITTNGLALVEPSKQMHAYAILQGFWAYPILAMVVLGTRRHRRRTAATRSR